MRENTDFIMGMYEGAEKVRAAVAAGKKRRVFDWDKAARLIRDRQPSVAEAGLAEDWNNTGGVIYEQGRPLGHGESYTYLSSFWATPLLVMDGDEAPCFTDDDDDDSDHSGDRWPESALAILRGDA